MPRKPRCNQIDLSSHTVYHVITRCTRQMHLLGSCDESRATRKGVMLTQLERLASNMAVGVAGFSLMDNHLHLLLKVDVDVAHSWSYQEVAKRWLALHPPRNGYGRPVDIEQEHIAVFCLDQDRVELAREKLMSISQFMKELKQETTQQINRLDETVGSLWAGRFKCKAVTDEAQLITTMAYIDLNPFAANLCKNPEEGKHTSLAARLHGGVYKDSADLVEENKAKGLQAKKVHKKVSQQKTLQEKTGWWLPIEAHLQNDATSNKTPSFSDTSGKQIKSQQTRSHGLASKTPIISGLNLLSYLKLLDATARLLRPGKKALANDRKPITDRLGLTPQIMAQTIQDWLTQGIKWARLEPLHTLAV